MILLFAIYLIGVFAISYVAGRKGMDCHSDDLMLIPFWPLVAVMPIVLSPLALIFYIAKYFFTLGERKK